MPSKGRTTEKEEGRKGRSKYSPLVSASEASHSSSRPYAEEREREQHINTSLHLHDGDVEMQRWVRI